MRPLLAAPPTLLLASAIAAVALEPSKLPEYQLPEYTVTALRRPTSEAAAPASVEVLTQEDIRRYGATTVVEALEKGAGVHFRSFSGNAAQAEPSLRGFGENSGLRVLVLVDGRKLNRPDMGLLDWSAIPVANIERIELIRGPQSALYGNHAVGGVIKITTRRGAERLSGSADAIIGSYGLWDFRAGVSTPVGSRVAQASAESVDSQGWRESSSYRSRSGSFSWMEPLAGESRLRLHVSAVESESDFPGALSEEAYFANPQSAAAADQMSESFLWSADASLEARPGPDRAIDAAVGFSFRDLQWSLDGIFADSCLASATCAPQWRAETEASTVALGADLFYDQLDFQRYASDARSTEIGVARLERIDVGGYVHWSRSLAERWSVTATARAETSHLRADNEERHFFDPSLVNESLSFEKRTLTEFGLAGSLGVVRDIEPGRRLWARVDRIYRYPAVDEVASYQGRPLAMPFNDELEAEQGWSLEVGADCSHGALSVDLGLFAMWMEGEIGYDRARGLNVNLSDTRRFGAEASSSLDVGDFTLSVRATAQSAVYADGAYEGKNVYLSPNYMADVSLLWAPEPRFSLEAMLRWTGSQWEGDDLSNERPRMDAYAVVDLIARVRASDRLSLFVSADNVFDERYASIVHSGGYYPGPGASLRAGASLTF